MTKPILSRSGLLVDIKNRGKDKKLIPWSLINKDPVIRSIKHCTAPKYGIDVYLVDKTVNGNRISGVFSTKKEAMKAIDMQLIRNGREPQHILKKLVK